MAPPSRHTVLFRSAVDAMDGHPLETPTAYEGSPAKRVRARVLRAGALTGGLAGGLANAATWGVAIWAGRLVELSGVGAATRLSLGFSLVREAQARREPAAWVSVVGSAFFPPDAAVGGVDLAALPVVMTPDVASAARAATQLLRSGGFGLVVLDLAPNPAVSRAGRHVMVPAPLLTKLAGLAQEHNAAVVFLTETSSEASSLGSLISLRCDVSRHDAGDGRFLCVAHALKDKRRGPGWSYSELKVGPVGLR